MRDVGEDEGVEAAAFQLARQTGNHIRGIRNSSPVTSRHAVTSDCAVSRLLQRYTLIHSLMDMCKKLKTDCDRHYAHWLGAMKKLPWLQYDLLLFRSSSNLLCSGRYESPPLGARRGSSLEASKGFRV